ncbi:MAG: HAD-IA family hydrolase [Terriglobales bacterium]
MVSIQAIIFDLGQTLIPFSLDRLRPHLDLLPREWFHQLETGTLSPQQFQAAICGRARLDPDAFAPWWNSIFEPRWLVPQAWIRTLLGRYRCGLLSNTNALHFAFLSAEQPLLAEFAFHILSHEVGACKPDARIYEAAEAAAGCAPEAILYFDDVPDFVAAARRRGWQATQFTGAEVVAQFLPELGTASAPGRSLAREG